MTLSLRSPKSQPTKRLTTPFTKSSNVSPSSRRQTVIVLVLTSMHCVGRYGETTERDYSKKWRMMSANSWSKTVITLSLGREWLSKMPCYPPLVFEPHAG